MRRDEARDLVLSEPQDWQKPRIVVPVFVPGAGVAEHCLLMRGVSMISKEVP